MSSKGWLIDSAYGRLRVLEVNTSGQINVKIQIETVQGVFDLGCPDMFVAIRDVETDEIWGSKYVSFVDQFFSCFGSATVFMDSGFPANRQVQIEIYYDSVQSESGIKESELIGKSVPVTLFEEDIISDPVESTFGTTTTDFFSGFNDVLKAGAIFMGLILLFKFSDIID